MRYIVILMILSLVSCSFYSTKKEEQTTKPTLKSNSDPTSIEDDVFDVDVWVDNPTPEQGSRVMLYGSLIKHGVHLGGMMMNAFWPDEDQLSGVPNCSVQVIYGSGICIVETNGFPAGVSVPLKVEFDYEGKTYTGSTEITPR